MGSHSRLSHTLNIYTQTRKYPALRGAKPRRKTSTSCGREVLLGLLQTQTLYTRGSLPGRSKSVGDWTHSFCNEESPAVWICSCKFHMSWALALNKCLLALGLGCLLGWDALRGFKCGLSPAWPGDTRDLLHVKPAVCYSLAEERCCLEVSCFWKRVCKGLKTPEFWRNLLGKITILFGLRKSKSQHVDDTYLTPSSECILQQIQLCGWCSWEAGFKLT